VSQANESRKFSRHFRRGVQFCVRCVHLRPKKCNSLFLLPLAFCLFGRKSDANRVCGRKSDANRPKDFPRPCLRSDATDASDAKKRIHSNEKDSV
jgi:hypothetical protein